MTGRLRGRFAAVLLLVFPALLHAAAAQEPTPHVAYDAAVLAEGDAVTIKVDLDRELEFSLLLFESPYRIVIDLPSTRFLLSEDRLRPAGMFQSMSYGAVSDSRSRMVIELSRPFGIARAEIVDGDGSLGPQLVLRIEAADLETFRAAVAAQPRPGAETTAESRGDRVAEERAGADRLFTVVVDPGHGGIDSGAVGDNGTLEKTITLAFGKVLADTLNRRGNVRAVLTREDDIFLSLKERVRIARQNGADLFISVHADSIRLDDFRGATVYTLSDRASDSVARQVARQENRSEILAGMETVTSDEVVADILVDLTRRETSGFSISFADQLVTSLKDKVRLINDPHRYAGFHVLRAPDVPSVLFEMGYLSNADDEALMGDPEWRISTARTVADAVVAFGRRTGALRTAGRK